MAPFQPVDGDFHGNSRSEPQLCVWKGGGFHLTPAADREYFDEAESVGFHHDSERDGVVLGLEPAPETDGTHVRALTRTDGDGADINALSILSELGIDYESIAEPHRFDLEEHDVHGPVVATVDIGPLANGAAADTSRDAEPGAEEQAAADAVEDCDEASDAPDETEGGSATEIFENAASNTVEWSDIDSPDWLDEGSFYSAVEEASTFEELREVLGWKDEYDGDLEWFVDRLGVRTELEEASNA